MLVIAVAPSIDETIFLRQCIVLPIFGYIIIRCVYSLVLQKLDPALISTFSLHLGTTDDDVMDTSTTSPTSPDGESNAGLVALISTFSLHLGTTDDDVMDTSTTSPTSPDGGSNAGLVAWLAISLVIIIVLIVAIVALAVVVYLGHRKNKEGSFSPPKVSPSREVEPDLAKEQ